MATFNKGILGGFSGKVGNVVGGSWRGIDYMRSKPTKVNNPNTPAQQTQRQKFALMIAFLKKIKPVIQAGFKTGSRRQTAYNSATSYNLKKAVTGTVPNVEIDFAALMVSRGTLMQAQGATALSDNPGEIVFSWNDNSGMGNAQTDDRALILVYNPVREQALFTVEDGPIREDATYTMTVPDSYGGESVETYIGFVTADGSEASDSSYLGNITIAETAPGG